MPKRKDRDHENDDDSAVEQHNGDDGGDDESDEGDSSADELIQEDGGESTSFDIEAFPLEEDDREGIINMITQTFLRVEMDTPAMADALLARNPAVGCVIGPAEDGGGDEESEHIVYGLISLLPLKSEKFADEIRAFILSRASSFSSSSVHNSFKDAFDGTHSTEWFINERLLRFPPAIAPPSFSSLRDELKQLDRSERPEYVLYIAKFFQVKQENEDQGPSTSGGASSAAAQPPSKKGKKRKLGKAEKKRRAAEQLAQSEIRYTNAEDALLEGIDALVGFDYPVHQDVESTSRFHIQRKDGQTLMPYRRVRLLTFASFLRFLDTVAGATL